MAIYKMVGGKQKLEEIPVSSFGQEGVLERTDLQRILRDQPQVLEEGLLIISEEFGNWQDSNRRIDLLGLDASGRLVVIELKRGDTGSHMDLQAMRYAAMVANMTYRQAVDACQAYLMKRASERGESVEEGAGENLIREQLGAADVEDQAISSEIPRIILVSENFSRELTTCVMWLNDSWLRGIHQEIKCIRLQPHRIENEILVETSQIVPLPEATDYLVRVGERERESRRQEVRSSERFLGGSAFEDSIEQAAENLRPKLNEFFEWAVSLEIEGLVELSSNVGKDTTLQLRVPRKSALISAYNQPDRNTAAIVFWTNSFRENAPDSAIALDETIGTNISTSSNSNVRRSMSGLPDNVWDLLTRAYREANGLLSGNEEPEPSISEN